MTSVRSASNLGKLRDESPTRSYGAWQAYFHCRKYSTVCCLRMYEDAVEDGDEDDDNGFLEGFQNFRLVCTTWKFAHDQFTKRMPLSYELRPTAEHILDQYRFQLDEFRQPSLSDMMKYMTRFPSLQYLAVRSIRVYLNL
jgi:hypothetical protein